MATQLFLLDTAADTHLATNNTHLSGATTGWIPFALGTARGSGVIASSATWTVAGPVTGIEVAVQTSAGNGEWISLPVSADVTISGTITLNIWALESNNAANASINAMIDVIRANATATLNSNTLVQIVKTARTTELTTSNVAVNFTATPTSTAVNRGDRIRIRIIADDAAANMAAGQTFTVNYNGSSAAASGDTYVTFTENFSFESAPAGSVLYLTDTASDVATASVDREAWTSRGAGVQTDVVNTAAGWTAPIQLTDTAGGTVVDWFTKQLQAFTLTGKAVANIRAAESDTGAESSFRCEIARVDSDGTNATVWGTWCIAATGTDRGELTASEVARTANVSGDDLAFTDGQRIRIRLYAEDQARFPMVTAKTVTLYYAGTSGGASGDTYITLPQSVSEYITATAGSAIQARRQRRANRFLTNR